MTNSLLLHVHCERVWFCSMVFGLWIMLFNDVFMGMHGEKSFKNGSELSKSCVAPAYCMQISEQLCIII